MSTDPAKNKPWDHEVPCWLEAAEFDFTAATPSEHGVPVGGLEICTTVHEQTELVRLQGRSRRALRDPGRPAEA
jgi:hypothetical protein